MSERYSKLFALPENLYAEGAPLLIAAGALLKDNQTGKVLAQLKFHSLSPKAIKAVKVKIIPMDTVSHPLGEAVAYQYLDLNAARCDEFGQKSPIDLPNAATRSFSAEVCEVAFTDNTLWQTQGEPWEPVQMPTPISLAVQDRELRKQIKLEYGNSFEYIPTNDKDLWMCSCGERNRKGEHTCARCSQELSRLLSMDMEDLKAKRDARLAAEKAQAEEDAAQAKARAKRNKRMAVIMTPILVVALIAAVFALGKIKKNNDYNSALRLLALKEYDEAISAFEALGDYKDSKRQIEIVQLTEVYNRAIQFCENKSFESALESMEAMSGFKDSQVFIDKLKEFIYDTALAQLEQEKYGVAKSAFAALGDFKDSADYLSHFFYKLIERTDKFPARKDTVEYEYDVAGNWIVPTEYKVGVMKIKPTYNEEGLIIGEKKTIENTTSNKSFRYFLDCESQFSYEYDKAGKVTKRIETTIHGEDARSGETDYIGVVTYKYNSMGQVTRREEQGTYYAIDGEKEYTSLTVYSYNDKGVLVSAVRDTKDGRIINSRDGSIYEITVEIDYDYTLDYVPDTMPVNYQLLLVNDFLEPCN